MSGTSSPESNPRPDVIDMTGDLRFILGDVPGSVLIQCGVKSGRGMKTQESKLAEHRFGDIEYQGNETVLIFDPTEVTTLVKGCSLTVDSIPFKVVKPVKLREDGSALAYLVNT